MHTGNAEGVVIYSMVKRKRFSVPAPGQASNSAGPGNLITRHKPFHANYAGGVHVIFATCLNVASTHTWEYCVLSAARTPLHDIRTRNFKACNGDDLDAQMRVHQIKAVRTLEI